MVDLSIIVVTKDNLQELKDTINSVHSLISNRIELIVVNGSSNKIMKENINLNLFENILILDGPDNGIYHGMNRGSRAAQGTFLWFLNSGDTCIDVGVLESTLLAIKGTSVDLLIGKQLPALKFSGISLKFSKLFLRLGARPVPHQSTLIKSDFFNNMHGYNQIYEICADQDFFLRSFEIQPKVSVLNEFMTERKLGGVGDSQSYGTFFDQMKKLRKLYNVNLNFLEQCMLIILNSYVTTRKWVNSLNNK